MKLPFLNKRKYIIVKAYTNISGVCERAPLSIGKRFKVSESQKSSFINPTIDYSTCFSRINTSKLSITIPCPSEIRISVDKNEVKDNVSGSCKTVTVNYAHDYDRAYGLHRNFIISKLVLPWKLEEKSGVKFVLARHMQNKTEMNVLSGVTEFATNNDINIFNLISKMQHTQTIPFLTPMASLYALSEKQVHLECEYSKQDYQRLVEYNYRPYWRADLIKKSKEK